MELTKLLVIVGFFGGLITALGYTVAGLISMFLNRKKNERTLA